MYKLVTWISLIVFSVTGIFSQSLIIDGTAPLKTKREIFLNLKLNDYQLFNNINLEEVNFIPSLTPTSKLRIDSAYGVNIREKHLKPEVLKTFTKRGEIIENSAWCGYINPTSASGTPITPPDLGKGYVKFAFEENLPRVKHAYLNILWAVGNLKKLRVYKATKNIESYNDIDTDINNLLGEGKKVEITEIVRNWLDNPEENYGLILFDSRGEYQYSTYPGSWHNTLGDYISIPYEGIELDVIFDLDPMFPPTYIPGKDLGYFVWKDSNGWHLRMSGGGYGYPHTFQGYFITDDTFIDATGINLETNTDTITLDVHRISFNFYVDGEEDGIDFKTNGLNPVKFYLQLDNKYQRNLIYIGRFKQHPDLYPVILQ